MASPTASLRWLGVSAWHWAGTLVSRWCARMAW